MKIDWIELGVAIGMILFAIAISAFCVWLFINTFNAVMDSNLPDWLKWMILR